MTAHDLIVTILTFNGIIVIALIRSVWRLHEKVARLEGRMNGHYGKGNG